jgi:hypothetical protein
MRAAKLLSIQTSSLYDYLRSLIDVYSNIVGIEWLKKQIQNNENADVVKRIGLIDKLSLDLLKDFDQISKDDMSFLLQISLDAFAVEIASSGKDIDLAKVLGRKKDVRGRLSGKGAPEWYFEVLIQGWYQEKSDVVNLDIDSLGLLKKGDSKCDFMISHAKGSERFDLVECKKISPDPVSPSDDDLDMDRLNIKIIERIKNVALPQLIASREVLSDKYDLGKNNVFVDITSYKENSTFLLPDCQRNNTHAYGFTQSQVDELVRHLKREYFKSLDGLIICWTNFLVIKGFPRAIVHNATHIDYSPDGNSIDKYGGWTVEMYPKSSMEGVREIRVSETARDWEHIVTTFNNLSDPSSFIKGSEL